MALVECKECKHEISTKAKTCPNCGAAKKRSIFRRLIKYSLIGFVALVVVSIVGEVIKTSSMTPEEKIAYDVEREQREAERIAKAAEKAKADEEARVIAEAKAAEKAKVDGEARVIAEAKAAEKAKADSAENIDIWPVDLYEKMTNAVATAPEGKPIWLGGIGTDYRSGKPVGLAVWSASGGPKAQIELVVSCFEDTKTELPEIVAYIDDLYGSSQFIDISYRYDAKPEQSAKWALIDKEGGGLYAHVDGDVHVRNMMAGNWLSLSSQRLDGGKATDKFSLAGFTRVFTETCSWHPKYAKWISTPIVSKVRAIEGEIQEFAKREYPEDAQMQDFVYKKQISAFRYLGKVKDSDSLKFAQREYPEDYSMQKFTYDKQMAAKRYIQTVGDNELKSFSARQYPQDYSMQKFTYDKQLAAKMYMSSVDNEAAKAKAARQYPKDYSMQKFTYDKLAY